jgi:hypothetical protein
MFGKSVCGGDGPCDMAGHKGDYYAGDNGKYNGDYDQYFI